MTLQILVKPVTIIALSAWGHLQTAQLVTVHTFWYLLIILVHQLALLDFSETQVQESVIHVMIIA
jgi:hypothetical protein